MPRVGGGVAEKEVGGIEAGVGDPKYLARRLPVITDQESAARLSSICSERTY